MSEIIYKVGDIIVNEVRQFAKIISLKNGVYGLSNWGTQGNAEKASVAFVRINTYGLSTANLKVVKSNSTVSAKKPTSKPASAKAKAEAKAKAKAKAKK